MSQIERAELEEIFLEYEVLTAQVDKLFHDVQSKYSKEVACTKTCSDCCYALFDLSLVEAMAINRAFHDRFGFGAERSAVLERAGEADRTLTRLKHYYYKEVKQGISDEKVMEQAARERVRCPLLGDDNLCLLYEHRPLTCRIYGVPTAIHGKGHVCGKCHFEKGGKYPTLQLDRIQDKLASLSHKIAKVLGSKYTELHHVYVPVSMALMNKYDEAYLGLKQNEKKKSPLE
jgi:Fe-S-cluster containining protein